MRWASSIPLLSTLFATTYGAVTVHHQAEQAQATLGVTSNAHETEQLVPPPLPDPLPALDFSIQLQTGGTPGASIVLPSMFLGFSIETSVSNQLLGRNSSFIQVPFLNLMQNIVSRCGAVMIRVGGNTQDYATIVDSLPDGRILEKDFSQIKENNPTQTPPLFLSVELLRLMRAISDHTNVKWYLGIPFNDTNFRLEIVDRGEEILGDHLLGWQAGNEPDFYEAHQHRVSPYGPQGYMNDVSLLLQAMSGDQYSVARTQLIAPSIANSNEWTLQQIWDLQFVETFSENLKYLAVERYPNDNCAAIFPQAGNTPKVPQEEFPAYLSHEIPVRMAGQYAADTAYAQTVGKPFLMFETNTASCGGFPGISDSFGAALWGLDYALSLANYNFSGGMFHVGGQRTFYNPFTAPPTNESTFKQWSVGPMYYAALVMAEIVGSNDDTQVLDLNANNGDIHTPAYAIYQKGGQPNKLALFNYMDDQTGASQINVQFSIGGAAVGQPDGTPGSVKVKYLAAPSVSTQANFTWAGQTFGDSKASDGRPMGEEDIQTVTCGADNTCTVSVPAPGFALVFLEGDPDEEAGSPYVTFSTTAYTKTRGTATIDPAILETSNGHKDIGQRLGSTSAGSAQNSGSRRWDLSLWGTGLAIVLGVFVLARRH